MGLQEVAAAFSAAPLEAGGWDIALRAMAALTGSQSGQIIGFRSGRGLLFNRITDGNVDIIRKFEEWADGYSFRNWRIAASAGPFEIRHEHHYGEVRKGGGTDVYDDFCRDSDMPFGCQTALLSEHGATIGLAVLRTRKDGRSSADQRRLFMDIAPHALVAARMQRSLEDEGARLIAGTLEAMASAAFLCDALGHVRAATAQADLIALDGRLIGVREGQLVATNALDNRALQEAMAAMLTAQGTAPSYRSLWLGMDLPVRERRFCELYQLPERSFQLPFAPRIMVTVRAAGDIAATERDALRQGLGLTAAEAEVAALLSEGLPRETIAEQRGTSVGTVTVQIKRLFEKTGVTREAELVALVRRLLR